MASNGLTLSPTKITTYLRCPRSYYYQYVEKATVPKSPAMVVGSVVHEVIQLIHERDWTLADKDSAAAALEGLWADRCGETTDPEDPAANGSIGDACNTWLPWYLRWREGQIDIAVEEKWELPVPGTDLVMRGIVDRVYRTDGETIISDVKTGKRAPSMQDLNTDLQLSLYSWAYREMSGQNREDAIEVVQIRSKQTLRSRRTDGYLQRVIADTVTPTATAIQAGLFPANPATKFGCGYCDYQMLCPVGQGCNGGDST